MLKKSHILMGTLIIASAILPVAVFAKVAPHRVMPIRKPPVAMHQINAKKPTRPMMAKKPEIGKGMFKNMVSGSVTAINGTSITMTGRNVTTYTVDASQAKFTKGFRNGTAIAVTDIQVGDHLMISGSINGTSITAITVNDMGKTGAFGGMRGGQRMGEVAGQK